jgi:hypothetical protein
MCMFCRSLFVLLTFFFWPLSCLSFDLRILITLWYLQTLLKYLHIYFNLFSVKVFLPIYFVYRAIVHIYHYCHSLVGINTELWHFRYQIVRKFCNHFYFILVSFSMGTWIIVKSTLKIGKNYENINYYIH